MIEDAVAVRRHEEELAALFETAAQLTAQLDVETVLQTIIERARSLVGTDLAYITLLDREAGCVRMRVASGSRTSDFMHIVLPLGSGLGGVVARDARSISTRDYLTDPRFAHDAEVDRIVALEGIRSILGVPLNGRSGNIGVLYVANRRVDSLTDANVELLAALGHHAALALENARLYEEAVAAARASEEAKAAAEAHYRDLALVHEIHQRLTDVLLAGEGVVGVARSLAAALDVGICITDRSQFVLVQAGPPGIVAYTVDGRGCLAQSFVGRSDIQAALLSSGADYQAVVLPGRDRVVCAVATRQELLGYIWVSLSAGRQASDALRTALEQAARAVALEMVRERAAVEIEARLRREFLDDLLREHPVPEDVLRHRARQVWQAFAVPHRPFVCRINPSPESSDGSLLGRARQIVADTRPGDFVSIYGDRLIGLVPVADREEAAAEFRRIQNALLHQGLAADLAIGPICRTFEDDRRAIRETRQLQDLLPRASHLGILWLEELGALLALFEPSAGPRLVRFVETTLGPLLMGDPSQGRQLLRTLDTYYKCLGNRADAARQLGVHINTLYKRLERLNALVGPLNDPVRSVPLQVAILAWSIEHPM
jgi:sugar diacid utilization regulator